MLILTDLKAVVGAISSKDNSCPIKPTPDPLVFKIEDQEKYKSS